MNDIFANILDVCVVIYLNDILIYLNNLQEYKKYIRKVFYSLKANKLYMLWKPQEENNLPCI